MAVSLTFSSQKTATGLQLILCTSNKGGNAAMAMWKVSLPDGLALQLPFEPLEGTKDLAADVEAVIGSWIILSSKLSQEQQAKLSAQSARVVGTVTGDGPTYAIEGAKQFSELLAV